MKLIFYLLIQVIYMNIQKKKMELGLGTYQKKGTVIFHDINLSKIYKRINKTIGAGWDNDRGVIRALEDFFQVKFDEKRYFQTIMSEFIIEHYPNCSGLTIIKKIMEKQVN